MKNWYRKSELADLPHPEWLIPNYLLARTLAQLCGPSKAGKTFLYTDWACTLALAGKRVAVLLGEGLYGMCSRLDAWEAHSGLSIPNNNLALRGGVAALADPASMRGLRSEMEKTGPFDLVIFDTFARFMSGFDENSTPDVSVAMENVGVLCAAAGNATCLLVTHFGWGGNRQRGSSAIYGACDTVLYFVPVKRGALKPEEDAPESDEEGYFMEAPAPKSKRSVLSVDKHRDAPDEIPPVTYERTDIDGTGSCVYLQVGRKNIAEVVDIRERR